MDTNNTVLNAMSWAAQLTTVAPELILLALASIIVLVDLGVKSANRQLTHVLSMLSLLGLAAHCACLGIWGQTTTAFNNMVVSDPLANWLKSAAALATMFTLTYARPYAQARGMLRGGELYSLQLFALLGMFVMISGNNFLVIYLGLELLTLSSYALVALRRENAQASEAAMKYFVLGALASGFLLYGLSMIYGATGSLDIDVVFKTISAGQIKAQVLVFGLVFVVTGLAFKFGAVPFHMWVPDVYHGAPTAVTLMLGAAPKLAAFAIAIRLLVQGLLPLAFDWQQMLIFLAIASLLVGNLAAIAQTNIKRMLAFSTIGQMGFIFLGLAVGVTDGKTLNAANAYSAALFYVISYVLTTLAAFGVILLLSREGFESDEIADLAGLNQRSPLYAAIMAVCLFSLAGIPPMVGFYAKLTVLQALVVSGSGLHIALAVFAVLMSLVAAFYYLRVVKVMYFDSPITATRGVLAPVDARLALALNGALVLGLGLFPSLLMSLCHKTILQTLAGA